jgi:hypothetical protein
MGLVPGGAKSLYAVTFATTNHVGRTPRPGGRAKLARFVPSKLPASRGWAGEGTRPYVVRGTGESGGARLRRSRTAELARPLASALRSRGTWVMENFSERVSLRQIQCRE